MEDGIWNEPSMGASKQTLNRKAKQANGLRLMH
jgi:hypothetical protein